MVSEVEEIKASLVEMRRLREEACFNWSKAVKERDEALARLSVVVNDRGCIMCNCKKFVNRLFGKGE